MKEQDLEIKKVKLDTDLPVHFNTLDKVYLAVSTVYDNPKYDVYTMVDRREWLGYGLCTCINVANFTNKQDADEYHDYVEKIMERQMRYKICGFHRVCNIENIKNFNKKILSMKIGIKTLEKQK